ncbi:hypothetical protein ACFPFV_13150 [Salinicoccus siamensis]
MIDSFNHLMDSLEQSYNHRNNLSRTPVMNYGLPSRLSRGI